jgi:2-oxoglutarate dehydrogenase E1 component
MGAYSYMLMNFDLVKWRLASLKAAAPTAGSYTRAKRRHAEVLLKWYLIKIIWINLNFAL